MILVTALLALIIGVILVPPVIYFGVPLSASGGSVSAREAVAVSLVGIVASGFIDFLLRSVLGIGWIFAPLMWIGVIKYLCPVTWPTAIGVGIFSWGLPAVVLRIIMII